MEDNTKTWGIRGISADVRQAVITQSQKQGIKAGEWLTVAILEKSDRTETQGKPWCLPMGNLLSVQRMPLLFWLCWNVFKGWELNLLTE